MNGLNQNLSQEKKFNILNVLPHLYKDVELFNGTKKDSNVVKGSSIGNTKGITLHRDFKEITFQS